MKQKHTILALPFAILSAIVSAADERCFDTIEIGMSRDDLLTHCGHPIDQGMQETTKRDRIEIYRGLDNQREQVQSSTKIQYWQYQETDGSKIRFHIIDGYVADKQRHHHKQD